MSSEPANRSVSREGAFRIVMVDPVPESFRSFFFDQLPGPEFGFECPTGPDPDEVLALVRGAQALITRRRFIDVTLIRAAGPTLRFIQVQGHLPDRVDLAAARGASVQVAVMPSKGCIAVAEHAMSLMLALARKIVRGHQGVVSGAYRRFGLQPARTSENAFAFNWLKYSDVIQLNGRQLGIVGLGEIGQEVARRARAFEMSIAYFDERQLPERFERMTQIIRILYG